MSSYRNVVVRGNPQRREGTAAGTITPGMLLAIGATLVAHASAGQNALPMFAVENSDLGNTVDDDYSSGDRVRYVVGRPGDEIQALLANGETVVVGSALVSNADGTLKVASAATVACRVDPTKTATTVSCSTTLYTDGIVGYSLEATTASGTTKILMVVA